MSSKTYFPAPLSPDSKVQFVDHGLGGSVRRDYKRGYFRPAASLLFLSGFLFLFFWHWSNSRIVISEKDSEILRLKMALREKDDLVEKLRGKYVRDGHSDVCSLPAETGPCRASFSRYFYDPKSGECREFSYGGCKGNANNFETKSECERRCSAERKGVCALEADIGDCKTFAPRYYYNVETMECREFAYGGCGGNENNFKTEKECREACVFGDGREEDVCSLPSKTGPCRALFERYYYDDGACKQFYYGGCDGNGNNFETRNECEKKCLKDKGVKKSEAACNQPKLVGDSPGAIERWYFDRATGKCTHFLYGGSGGNDNNFDSKSKCEADCLQ